jgi:hypothetical protein
MTTVLLIVEFVVYALALWLGLYLLNRDASNHALRLSGLGLIGYALTLGLDLLSQVASAPTAPMLQVLTRVIIFIPACCWVGAVITLLPENSDARRRLIRLWRYALLPLVVLLVLGESIVHRFSGGLMSFPGVGYGTGAVVVISGLLISGWSLLQTIRSARPKNAYGVVLAATMFFTLGTVLLVLPLEVLPREWLLLAIGGDVVVLGIAVAALDAFEQGEAFLPDFIRSLDFALLSAALFGGQVALVMILSVGTSFVMMTLLLSVVTTAIIIPTYADAVQRAVDKLAFARFPQLRQARDELRTTASMLPRVGPTLDFQAMDDAELIRLTRRALSHFGDLPRLATSPLSQLPLINRRLAERGVGDDTLERAVELKAVLAESVRRLKPRTGGDFGTSDEWRYYNALYFPYVLGLRPYSQRSQPDLMDPTARAALDWFRAQVPERTLYNWQSAAAKLVAHDLRERAGM